MLTRRSFVGAALSTPLIYSSFGSSFAAVPKDFVVIGQQIDDMISFDPGESFEASGNEIEGNCYRKLVQLDVDDPTKVIGDLAESWDVSPDGQTLTFHLREDGYFDTGNRVKGEDVEFSLHRAVIMNKAPAFIINQFGFDKDNVAQLIKSVDEKTLIIALPAPQATTFVLRCLTANVGAVIEKSTALANQVESDWGNGWLKTHSAGSGPYKLRTWAASDRVILDANPHFKGELPIRRVIVRHIKEPEAQFLALQQGDIDIARDLSSDRLKAIQTDKQYHAVKKTQLTSLYLAMNQSMPELSQRAVQQAIKWAIDYDGIAANITPHVWSVCQSFLPRGVPGALNEQPYKKDPAKAKALLAEAGFSNGFTVTMDHYATSPYNEVAQAIQRDLAEVGINVQLLAGEQRQIVTKTRARGHQLALLVWGADYFDPNSNAQAFCFNPDNSDDSKFKMVAWRSRFSDQDLAKSVELAARELDDRKRVAIYEDMQRKFWNNAPFAFVLQRNAVAMMRTGVEGLILGPLPAYTRYLGLRKS